MIELKQRQSYELERYENIVQYLIHITKLLRQAYVTNNMYDATIILLRTAEIINDYLQDTMQLLSKQAETE